MDNLLKKERLCDAGNASAEHGGISTGSLAPSQFFNFWRVASRQSKLARTTLNGWSSPNIRSPPTWRGVSTSRNSNEARLNPKISMTSYWTWKMTRPKTRKVPRMSSEAILLEEPRLEFRYEQFLEDPHDGLSLFGPYGMEVSSHPMSLTIGAIGTPDGLQDFTRWCRAARGPVYPGEALDPHLWPVFPGFEAAFCSDLPREPAWSCELDLEKLKQQSMLRDPSKRAAGVVEEYLAAIKKTEKREEPFGVLVCVVPDFVWKHCRPESFVPGAIGEGVSKRENSGPAGSLTFSMSTTRKYTRTLLISAAKSRHVRWNIEYPFKSSGSAVWKLTQPSGRDSSHRRQMSRGIC